jgi:putative tryptophan/tyrosine transport system substrate-binding protein
MKRRAFITLLGVAAAWPLAGRAQDSGRNYRLAVLFPSPRDSSIYLPLFNELQEFGFVEGQNLTIDFRAYGQHPELISKYTEELVKTPADVFLAAGDIAIRAAQQTTRTIPILGFTDDMVGSGFVTSLARPNGNTTGVSLLSTELDGKRQDILREAVPGLRRMAALADSNTTSPQQLQALQDAARARGFELSICSAGRAEDIVPAIDAAKKSSAQGLNVLASPLWSANRRAIIEHTASVGLPAIYQWPEEAEEGGLLAYGPRLVQLYRDVYGRQLIKLLRGANSADLPVEQPTKFEFIFNLKTARALGLDVPTSLQLRADEVIE